MENGKRVNEIDYYREKIHEISKKINNVKFLKRVCISLEECYKSEEKPE